VLWFGRALEGGKTDSLRAESFPEMRTVAAVNAFRAVRSFHEVDVDLSSIEAPTLILYGEHETSVVRRHVPTLAAGIPGATVREVPDAGHASPWDNPEFFNGAIEEFLAQRVHPADGEGDPAADPLR
jgi:pimeloyl-ACP methyl ester carboxylesterase